MTNHNLSRRQFIQTSSALLGATLLSPWTLSRAEASPAVKRTALDQVTLGKTGLKLSRLGFGTGSRGGRDQFALGKEEFIKLIRYAYDQGITYIDAAQQYQTFGWIAEAIKGLPREKLFVQSKIPGQPEDVLAAIDSHRKNFNTDYVDSMLIHCMVKDGWTDQWKRVMDGFNEAQDKKWIRARGVSCHTLPALCDSAASDWPEVHLVRVNPQGKFMDGPIETKMKPVNNEVAPVMAEIKTMHAKGRGVIGMTIIGNGAFTDPADREKSVRFAMGCKEIDAVVIGFAQTEQIDEAIQRINHALAET